MKVIVGAKMNNLSVNDAFKQVCVFSCNNEHRSYAAASFPNYM